MWRRLVSVAATVAALVSVSALPADADIPVYVALGDSYSSGTGTTRADGECRRSPDAYPELYATTFGLRLRHRACTGATTRTLIDTQLADVDRDTNLITVTIGGNDAGFAQIISACVGPLAWHCRDVIDAWAHFVRDDLPVLLAETHDAIRDKAPYARVVVLGYPRLYDKQDTCWLLGMPKENQDLVNGFATLLNETLAHQALAAGADWVPVEQLFEGHGICSAQPWISGFRLSDSAYHPNDDGHRLGYLEALSTALHGTG